MKLFAHLFASRNPARELALQGVAKRRASVRETAQRMREELGLPPHPALEAQP